MVEPNGGYAGSFQRQRRAVRLERSEDYQHCIAACGKAAGEDTVSFIMILASAMRHCVGRPAISMEGGCRLWNDKPVIV